MGDSLGKIADLCSWYGLTVLLVSATVTMVYAPTAYTDYLNGGLEVYFALSAIPAAAIFIYRTGRYGFGNTLNILELVIAGLSAIGLSLPVSVLGLMVAAVTRGDYKGVEKWLPEVQDLEKLLQKAVTDLELSEETRIYCMELLGKVRDKELHKGRENPVVVGAIVYIGSRKKDEPRTLDEISDVTGAEKKPIGRAYRSIARETGLRIIPPRAMNFVDRFADRLDLPENVSDKAKDLISQAEEENFTSGKSPRGIAASALYLSCYLEDEYRSMNEMSDILDITTITIRERSKDFIRGLEMEDYPEHFEETL